MRHHPAERKTVTPGAAGKWPTMAAVGLGTFMSALNASIVNIALPYIGTAFQASLGTTEWVVMAYLLIISSLLLTFGRLGDIYGHRPLYNLGLFLFAVGSALCALAPSIHVLIACRVFQGLGAGMVMAIGPAVLTAAFPATERGKALGLLGTSVAMALALGPTVGGLLLYYFDWRYIFLLNVPIGITALFLSWRVLAPGVRRERPFDLPGSLVLFVALGSLLLALSHGQEWGWSTPPVLGLLILAAAGFAFFIRHQGRIPHPMVPLALFRNRVFSAANISQLLNFIVQYTVVFLLPFYFKEVLRLAPAAGGLLLSSFPLTMMVVAPLAGALSDRIGSRSLAALGMGLGTVSLLLLAALDAGSRTWAVVGPLLLLGLGNGVFQAPNNSAIMGAVPREHQGLAGGFMASMRNIGMVMGVALAGAVFNTRLAAHHASLHAAGLSGGALQDRAFVAALHDALMVSAGLGLIGVITSLVRGDGDRPAKA
ncbi:MAG: MFS transporter [Thermoanaerobacterales bacterium]|nr:MFS transporter [Bacillota bacterium]MDI6907341.1 MFS transporter [Thermoanaerobacterales bacterium]